MNGANFKFIDALNIASLGTTYAKDTTGIEFKNLLKQQDRVEVQVDWAGLTGTLDTTVQIQQRGEGTMQWNCIDATDGNLLKILKTAAGTFTFTMWTWTGDDLRVLITKNNCTGGTLNFSIGMRG
jgi:hypothetical protein